MWDSYGLSNYELGTGSFSQDARGRWYFNSTVKVEAKPSTGTKSVGIDLGLKATATCSDGEKLERRYITAEFAKQLGVAQRANKAQRVKAIHAKIKHSRQDAIHKFTTVWSRTMVQCSLVMSVVRNWLKPAGQVGIRYRLWNAKNTTGIQSESAVSGV